MILGMPPGQILRNARLARQQTGAPVARQIAEMTRLRFSRHGVFPEDYFRHRLFEPSKTWAEKSAYVGLWARSRLYRVQDQAATKIAEDKIESDRVLRGAGLPVPEIIAHTGNSDNVEGAVWLQGEENIVRWFRETAPYPHFAKPAVSYLGYGAFLIDRYDAANDTLQMRSGSGIPVTEFARTFGAGKKSTMMFQRLLKPHPNLRVKIGHRLSTARIVLIGKGSERKVYAAGLRIPVGNAMTDNFQAGKSGALLGRLDCKTGEIIEVLAKLGIEWSTCTTHPDTDGIILGMTVPDWPGAIEMVMKGAEVFDGLVIQSWDVAFTDQGPVLVEINATGSVHLPQLALGKGLAQPEFLALYDGGRI